MIHRPVTIALASLLTASALTAAVGQNITQDDRDPASVLTAQQWQQVDRSIDRALAWLATQQQPDGSFLSLPEGQPAVTSLCVLAFLARGHLPGEGQYGSQLSGAIEYVISCQHRSGMISAIVPDGQRDYYNSGPAAYNHAIAGLMLSEVYGMTDADTAERIRETIERAVRYMVGRQIVSQPPRRNRGGWRYFRPPISDADLSVTSWQIKFLRSAKNAGFDVPAESIDRAVQYTQRCFDPRYGTFVYETGRTHKPTRAMAGSGILTLSLAGLHDSPLARAAGQWILRHPFDRYNVSIGEKDRYHYGAYYCSQAMYQLGGDYWAQFYPRLVRVLLRHQQRDGPWAPDSLNDGRFGSTYTTALMVLALAPPYQILPIFQR